MREEVYEFGLTPEQEERAKKIHDESIVIDMLFQGPIGTHSIPEEVNEELFKLTNEKFPNEVVSKMEMADNLIKKWSLNGKLKAIFKDCWYDSGITAANRQLSVSDTESILATICDAQLEFDTYEWLIKAKTVEDIFKAKEENLKAGIVTCQETLGFGKNFKLLEMAYDFGLRVVQLTYNNQNFVGSGCMEEANGGVSVFGKKFIAKLNELGIVVDTGHCGKQTTLDACKYSNAPVIASHTAVENVFQHARAKSDEELIAIANTGGVIGIFAMPWFIAKDPENTTIDDLLDHIDYVVKLVGADHVGIGTDWPMPQTKWMALDFKKYLAHTMGFKKGDGPSTEYVKGLKEYRTFGNITRGLVARGYCNEDISKIIGGNWVRVFKEVWK